MTGYDQGRLNHLLNAPIKKISSKEKRERFHLKRVVFDMPEDLFHLFEAIVLNQPNLKSVYRNARAAIKNQYIMIGMCILISCLESKYKGLNPKHMVPMQNKGFIDNIDTNYLREIANWIDTGTFAEEANDD
jgi:hypothetical protein